MAPWLYRLAVTCSLLHRRKQGRGRKLIDRYAERRRPTESDRQGDPLDWLLAKERRGQIRLALTRVPKRDAELLLLKYTEDWSYRQLAQHLGVSESAIEARLHRARGRHASRIDRLGSCRGRNLTRKPGIGDGTMNQIDGTSIAGRDDRRLDLLVDGELSEEDRGALLRLLDREPGGWRRCALAFLEAQAWKRELPALLDSSGEAPDRLQPRRRWWWSRHAGTLLAMAATFLVALTLGMSLVSGMKWRKRHDDRGHRAESAHHRRQSLADGHGGRQGERPAPRRKPSKCRPSKQIGLTRRGCKAFPSRFPPTCSRRWSRAATRSSSGGELLPVQMNDGRQLVVPVDQVDIRFVGRPKL